jgi:hypothetical protein
MELVLNMEHVRKYERRPGADIGFHSSNLHPATSQAPPAAAPRESVCPRKNSGINKNFTLDEMIKMAYNMVEKPNIIIKAGPKAMWYLKSFPKDVIESGIEKQKKWRDVSRKTMYIIEWDL